jgi:hypothetical protein
VAALLAADHARLGKRQSTHRQYYRRIKGEDQALCGVSRRGQGAEKPTPFIRYRLLQAEENSCFGESGDDFLRGKSGKSFAQ